MDQNAPLPFAAWQNFYVIAGSAAGALTGVQFVVIALITQARAAASMREIRAFGSPTVVHFCSALLTSALMAVPFSSLTQLGICFSVCGLAGLAYSLETIWHARKADYDPEVDDWIWYAGLPCLAHAMWMASGALIWWRVEWGFYVVAGATLLFLLMGVRNSWDTVTYIAVKHANASKENK